MREPGRWGERQVRPSRCPRTADSGTDRKPAIEVPTDSAPGQAPSASACEPYREEIEAALGLKSNAVAIYVGGCARRALCALRASFQRGAGDRDGSSHRLALHRPERISKSDDYAGRLVEVAA